MKPWFFLIFIMLFSCSEKTTKCQDISETIDYLEEYSSREGSTKTYLTREVEEKILDLESKTDVLLIDGGNLICRCFVAEKDILNWRLWLADNCKNLK